MHDIIHAENNSPTGELEKLNSASSPREE